ncbi:hypothetical protein [Staphylococcus equorum]|uniref:hypothetical protein n=1 Tax=Staphylococcus equorum TaxID=246432 RepID=UPI001F3FD0D5|nr:hypothetical protein [Staphylococcus equorum]MCE5008025.1 hypothetical protein [Staphylococcus equorum]
MKKLLSLMEKYLLVFTTFIFWIAIFVFGNSNSVLEILNQIINNKNDIIVNIASIFIGMYITIALMYPTYIKGGGLDKLTIKNYFVSYKYILFGMLWSFIYIINFLFDDIIYSYTLLNSYLFILMFVSFIRVLIFVVSWQIFDILKMKRKNNDSNSYEKEIYEKLKNIEDYLNIKK